MTLDRAASQIKVTHSLIDSSCCHGECKQINNSNQQRESDIILLIIHEQNCATLEVAP